MTTPKVPRPFLKGVVLDMDGTLTIPNLDFKKMYEACDVPLTSDILTAVAAKPAAERQHCEQIIEAMEAEGRATLQLMPGAVELLGFLQSRNMPTGLVTRNTKATVQALEQLLQDAVGSDASTSLQNLNAFQVAISRDDDVPAKPDPAAMNLVAEGWELSPKEILMIGDSPSNDVGFGRAAGVWTLLLDTGRRHTEGGKTNGADLVVETLFDVPAMLMAHFKLPDMTKEAKAARDARVPSLAKYDPPSPQSEAAHAAVRGDVPALAALHEAGRLHESCGSEPYDLQANTPLIWAADAGQTAAVEYLLSLDGGQDINRPGYLGSTAIARASRKDHVECLRVLLAHPGSDPNMPTIKQQHPLHIAAFKRHRGATRALLEGGASTTVVDRKGRTPAEDTDVEEIREAIYAIRRGESVSDWLP